jgi:hypothetical protein
LTPQLAAALSDTDQGGGKRRVVRALHLETAFDTFGKTLLSSKRRYVVV